MIELAGTIALLDEASLKLHGEWPFGVMSSTKIRPYLCVTGTQELSYWVPFTTHPVRGGGARVKITRDDMKSADAKFLEKLPCWAIAGRPVILSRVLSDCTLLFECKLKDGKFREVRDRLEQAIRLNASQLD